MNVSRIDQDMHDVIRCTLEYERRHRRHNYGRPYSTFELLRYDFLLNRSDAYPHLMEINMSPSLHPYFFPNDGQLKKTVIRDVIRMLNNTPMEHWRDMSKK